MRVYDREVDIAAKLRSAVQNARLPTHQQRLDTVVPECRKDSGNRAVAQGCLLGARTSPTVADSPPNVPGEPSGPTLTAHPPPVTRGWCGVALQTLPCLKLQWRARIQEVRVLARHAEPRIRVPLLWEGHGKGATYRSSASSRRPSPHRPDPARGLASGSNREVGDRTWPFPTRCPKS